MVYIVTFRDSFLDDLRSISKDVQAKFSTLNAKLREEPLDWPNVKALKIKHCYRYRIGDYRLIYTVRDHVIEYLMIGSRADVCKRLRYDPESHDDNAARQAEALLSTAEGVEHQKTAAEYWQEIAEKQQSERKKISRLPRKITATLLMDWGINSEHHDALCACKTEDDLNDADVPYEVMSLVTDCLFQKSIEEVVNQPVRVSLRSEDFDEYLQGKLSEFLLKLDEDQEKLVDWSLRGPVLVKGGPGSGKSTVALYRAAALVVLQEGI